MSEQVVNTVDAAPDEYFPDAPVLFVRIAEAMDRIKNGICPMRIPADRSGRDTYLQRLAARRVIEYSGRLVLPARELFT